MRYLGHIYEGLTTNFAKRILMSEMAARSVKTLFRKTIQDIILQESYTVDNITFHGKICDFLNCILGMSYETAEIWKVISAHVKSYFGKDINFNQIDRYYFVISLVLNCKFKVYWNNVSA